MSALWLKSSSARATSPEKSWQKFYERLLTEENWQDYQDEQEQCSNR
jgi:hypothetical protein